MTSKNPDRAVARELRKIKRAHPDLNDHPDAVAAMGRLARLRCRFSELSALVEADGGANPQNVALVAECRQLSRAAGSIERELRGWWTMHPATSGTFGLLNLAREQLLARAKQAEPIRVEAGDHQPFRAAALLRRHQDDAE